jgi:cytochrome c6
VGLYAGGTSNLLSFAGLKASKQYMNHIFYFVIVLALFMTMLACGEKKSNPYAGSADGQAIYKKYCVVCHGADGKLGLNGSKDISVSLLTEAQRIEQITNGKNTMTPFKGILSPEEIKAVAAYSMTLTKK